MFPQFESYIFTIGIFTGVSLFIYLLLDIKFVEIKNKIRDWIIYLKVIELPKEKESRKSVYDKVRMWLNKYEMQGDVYIDKFNNWREKRNNCEMEELE